MKLNPAFNLAVIHKYKVILIIAIIFLLASLSIGYKLSANINSNKIDKQNFLTLPRMSQIAKAYKTSPKWIKPFWQPKVTMLLKPKPETNSNLSPAMIAPTVQPVYDANTAFISISSDGPWKITDAQNHQLVKLSKDQVAKISYLNNKYLLITPSQSFYSSTYLQAVPIADSILNLPDYYDWNWNKTVNLNSFRGKIEVRYSTKSKVLWAINKLPLEDYLKGITEASPNDPEEHLKVMAIIERSYAWYHLQNGGKHPGEPFILKNSRNGNGDDQIYQGYLAEKRLPTLVAAVKATSGKVVTYNGQPVITPYSTSAGGRTLSPKEAGWNFNWPWVKSLPDPDTAGMPRIGHGVGLSGVGSRKRAERGENYRQILSYYFPGTSIGSIPSDKKNINIAIYSVS